MSFPGRQPLQWKTGVKHLERLSLLFNGERICLQCKLQRRKLSLPAYSTLSAPSVSRPGKPIASSVSSLDMRVDSLRQRSHSQELPLVQSFLRVLSETSEDPNARRKNAASRFIHPGRYVRNLKRRGRFVRKGNHRTARNVNYLMCMTVKLLIYHANRIANSALTSADSKNNDFLTNEEQTAIIALGNKILIALEENELLNDWRAHTKTQMLPNGTLKGQPVEYFNELISLYTRMLKSSDTTPFTDFQELEDDELGDSSVRSLETASREHSDANANLSPRNKYLGRFYSYLRSLRTNPSINPLNFLSRKSPASNTLLTMAQLYFSGSLFLFKHLKYTFHDMKQCHEVHLTTTVSEALRLFGIDTSKPLGGQFETLQATGKLPVAAAVTPLLTRPTDTKIDCNLQVELYEAYMRLLSEQEDEVFWAPDEQLKIFQCLVQNCKFNERTALLKVTETFARYAKPDIRTTEVLNTLLWFLVDNTFSYSSRSTSVVHQSQSIILSLLENPLARYTPSEASQTEFELTVEEACAAIDNMKATGEKYLVDRTGLKDMAAYGSSNQGRDMPGMPVLNVEGLIACAISLHQTGKSEEAAAVVDVSWDRVVLQEERGDEGEPEQRRGNEQEEKPQVLLKLLEDPLLNTERYMYAMQLRLLYYQVLSASNAPALTNDFYNIIEEKRGSLHYYKDSRIWSLFLYRMDALGALNGDSAVKMWNMMRKMNADINLLSIRVIFSKISERDVLHQLMLECMEDHHLFSSTKQGLKRRTFLIALDAYFRAMSRLKQRSGPREIFAALPASYKTPVIVGSLMLLEATNGVSYNVWKLYKKYILNQGKVPEINALAALLKGSALQKKPRGKIIEDEYFEYSQLDVIKEEDYFALPKWDGVFAYERAITEFKKHVITGRNTEDESRKIVPNDELWHRYVRLLGICNFAEDLMALPTWWTAVGYTPSNTVMSALLYYLPDRFREIVMEEREVNGLLRPNKEDVLEYIRRFT